MPEWLTYAQAGARFGMSADAVRMRARRLGWRTQPGNDGRALVLVPDDIEVQPRERSPERAHEHSAERSPEQGEIARLTVLLTAADARAEKADLRADRAEQRAEQAEQRADAAILRADAADADRRTAQARVDAAEGRAAGRGSSDGAARAA